MILHVQTIFPCLLRLFCILHCILIKNLIIFIVSRIYRCAGLRIFMKNVLCRMNSVITDQLLRLPQVTHSVIISCIQYSRKNIKKINIEFCICLFCKFNKLCYINSGCHGCRTFAVFGKMPENTTPIIFILIYYLIIHFSPCRSISMLHSFYLFMHAAFRQYIRLFPPAVSFLK